MITKKNINIPIFRLKLKIVVVDDIKEALKINPNITQVELSNKLNVSRRTISTLLANLKEKSKIERVGSDRKGYWKILQ